MFDETSGTNKSYKLAYKLINNGMVKVELPEELIELSEI